MPRASAKKPQPAAQQTKILAVDDSATIRRVLTKLLESQGHTVEAAASGEEAFSRCLAEPFDLVISDVNMGALSGMQLCRLLRSDPATADMPIVLLTANDDPRSRFWGRHAGASAYVTKETLRQRIPEVVTGLLEDAPPRPETLESAKGSPPDPLGRLSQLLDDLLFKAVIASDVRKLVDTASDSASFAKGVLSLASDVADYGYLVLHLNAPAGKMHGLYAREPLPETLRPETMQALDLPENPGSGELVMKTEAEALPADAADISPGAPARFPIRTSDENLGELVAFTGNRRMAPRDLETLESLASEIALAAKTVFLMEQTRRMAFTDQLTGLHNRRQTARFLSTEIERAERYEGTLSVILCDIDHFKNVNDTFGHNIGDDVLKAVSGVLKHAIRRVDIVGRWGGEEFLIVLPSTAEAGARIVAERVRRRVEQTPSVEGGPERTTISLGVASFAKGESMDGLVDRADRALYHAKRRGRNRVEATWSVSEAGIPRPAEG